MKNRQYILLICSVLFALASCAVFYLLYKAINAGKHSTDQAKIEWKTEDNRRESIKSLDRLIKKIEVEKKSIESHFAQSSDVVPFLDSLEQSAPKVGAKAEVTGVNLTPDNSSIIVDLSVVGSFESVYKYLTLLENSPYELEISSFVLNKIEGGAVVGWQMSIKVKLLSFIPKQ